MAMQAGYWVDMWKYQFTDGESTETWIQAMPLGKYQHPLHGEIDITPARVTNFAENVKNGVRTQQLDIDYDHKEHSGAAAGWVKDAEARPDGLWLLVDWTKTALQQLKDKAYRYFSPEFNDEWTHPKDNKTYKDVLFGGAITNRPFLKDILPINMSEMTSPDKPNEGGKGMNEAQIAAAAVKLGLPTGATGDDVFNALNELEIQDAPVDDPTKTPEAIAAAEAQAAELKKLSETNPMIAKMVEQQTAMAAQLSETTKALRLSEVDRTVTRLAEKATKAGWALPPATQVELATQLLSIDSKQLSESVVKSFEAMLDTKLVQLGELGTQRHGDGNVQLDENPAVKKLNESVSKLMESNKQLTYADAVDQFSRQDPQGYAEYTQAVYSVHE